MQIVHVLADGRELDSLDGFVIEQSKNEEFYEKIIKEIEKKSPKVS